MTREPVTSAWRARTGSELLPELRRLLGFGMYGALGFHDPSVSSPA